MTFTVRPLSAVSAAQLDDLAEVLTDCVDGGASVSFMSPFGADQARAFWQQVAAGVAAGERALLVAEEVDENKAGHIVGTVQLVLAQPPNQPHRADLAKLLVHRRARRAGVAEALMRAAEPLARAHGKTLLVLDTASDTAARLYERLGWQKVGVIPGYALLPDGGLCDTVYYWRRV